MAAVVPSEGLGLHLEPSEFQVTLKCWLGPPVYLVPWDYP